ILPCFPTRRSSDLFVNDPGNFALRYLEPGCGDHLADLGAEVLAVLCSRLPFGSRLWLDKRKVAQVVGRHLNNVQGRLNIFLNICRAARLACALEEGLCPPMQGRRGAERNLEFSLHVANLLTLAAQFHRSSELRVSRCVR